MSCILLHTLEFCELYNVCKLYPKAVCFFLKEKKRKKTIAQ